MKIVYLFFIPLVHSFFLTPDECDSVKDIQSFEIGSKKLIYTGLYKNNRVIIKKLKQKPQYSKYIEADAIVKTNVQINLYYFGNVEQLFSEAIYLTELEKQYPDQSLHIYGICMIPNNMFLVMDRYNALEEYKNISQWKRLFNRMANFYGGSLTFDDFNIKNFVIHNNEIHILDFDNIFVVDSPKESIQMNTKQLKQFLVRNHSMVGEGRVINDILTI
jgi:hypothetical protein